MEIVHRQPPEVIENYNSHYQMVLLRASAVYEVLSVTLDSCLSLQILGGGSLPCDLTCPMGLRKGSDLWFVYLFLAVRTGVLEWKPFILFLFFCASLT